MHKRQRRRDCADCTRSTPLDATSLDIHSLSINYRQREFANLLALDAQKKRTHTHTQSSVNAGLAAVFRVYNILYTYPLSTCAGMHVFPTYAHIRTWWVEWCVSRCGMFSERQTVSIDRLSVACERTTINIMWLRSQRERRSINRRALTICDATTWHNVPSVCVCLCWVQNKFQLSHPGQIPTEWPIQTQCFVP